MGQMPGPSYPSQLPPMQPYPMQPAPRRRGVGFWLLIVGGIGLLACVGICVAIGGLAALSGSKPTATPQLARFTGTGSAQVTTKNWELSVTGVDQTKTLAWTTFGNKQDAVGQWLLITTTLKNTGKENFGFNTWDFEVRDSAGNLYKHSTELAALSYPDTKGAKSASNQQVPPGVAVSVILVFDINPEAKGLQLVFQQDQKPRIDLGRGVGIHSHPSRFILLAWSSPAP